MPQRPSSAHLLHGSRTLRTFVGLAGASALIALGSGHAVGDETDEGLALGPIAPIQGVEPGSVFDVPVTLKNTGAEALDKVWLSYALTQGLSHTELPANCVRHQVPSYDEMPRKSVAVCEYEQTVEPGIVYTPEQRVAFKAEDRALYDDLHVAVADYDLVPPDSGSSAPGTGPVQKLVPQDAAVAADFRSDGAWVQVSADNTADFKVAGDRLKARVGDSVTADLSFTNAGPAWVMNRQDLPSHLVLVTLPAGTKAVKIPGLCNPSDEPGSYRCGSWQRWVEEDYTAPLTFTLKVEKAVPGAKGTVALTGEPRPFDKNPANDTAAIELDVADGGSSTGGSGGTGGSGSSTGGSGGSDASGGSGSSTTGGSGSSTTGGGGSSSTTGGTGTATTGGNLAATGSVSALPLAGAAAAAVAAGGGLVLALRRRRAQRQ
ncbi:hypothetical protein ACWGJT_24710 [Streptomyces xantholiticus]